MMYQNPDKYDSTLKELVRKVYEASPLFKERIDNIKSIFKKYSDLCKEEEELNKKKSEELSLYKNGSERCEQVKESASILEDQYKIVIEQLRTAAIKEAKLALQNRNRPLIFSKIQINGQTNLVKNFRMKLRLISLKSKIIEKLDYLHELQRNSYCFDEFSNPLSYKSVCFSDFDFQNFSSHSSDIWSTQSVSKYLLEHFQEQYQQIQRISQRSITPISSSISPSIDKIEFPSSIPLNCASFETQRDRKKINNNQFNTYLSDIVSRFEKIISSEKDAKEKINNHFSDIDALLKKRQEILREFSISKDDENPVKVISCTSSLIDCAKAIRKCQTVIDTLNAKITTISSVPNSIWDNQRQIQYKMEQLLKSIDRITNFLSKTQKHVKIEPFGYRNYEEQIEIEEISSYQINKIKEQISELQDAFAELEKEKYSTLEEISDTINDLEQIKQLQDESKTIFENEKDSNSSNANNIFYIEDEEIPEIMQKKATLIEKQNEELRKLMEVISTIPDELKEINFNQEDIKFEPTPLPVIQLPPLLRNKEDSSFNHFQLSNSQSSLTDEISEMNTQLIEQIKAKNALLKAQSSDLISIPIQQEGRIEVVKNEELDSIMKSIQPTSKPFYDSNDYEQLTEKKNRLIAHVNELNSKLSKVRDLKSNIAKMEIKIKNFPNFKEKQMKELDKKKDEINDLKEQIKEKENSKRYKEYMTICEKIEIIKEAMNA